ncbi:MAG: HEAT repeat domain-containing protein [Nitrosopumilaceae archaeon]|nr:HEAT repeat domain-containing protein [Nitrosopumilaceae archaeon]
MNESFEKIIQILDLGSKKEKIDVLESLIDINEPQIINKIISKLDDPDIEVRGEVFSALVLNNNKIARFLIDNLNSESKNVRGFSALVLANRKDLDAIPSLINLTKDSSSMVRSCAVGALGYLNAKNAQQAIHDCLFDSNLEVKKSALKAAIDIDYKISEKEINEITKEGDDEITSLLTLVKKR